jgi:hypothetical protein
MTTELQTEIKSILERFVKFSKRPYTMLEEDTLAVLEKLKNEAL